ncbi:MAG: hypothetical protein NVV63_02420 [Opitutus sp.]|nr:hypothetical protein [Opitutus sp.]
MNALNTAFAVRLRGPAFLGHVRFGASLLFAGALAASAQTIFVPGGTVGSTTSTSVGIGISTPDRPLTFAKTTGEKISLYSSSSTAQDYYGFAIESSELRYQVPNARHHSFFVGAAEALRINSDKVGIGTNAPTSRLTVGGTTASIDEVITVKSLKLAGLELQGDTANASGEVGGAYVLLSQDGGTVYGIVGINQKAETDPRGTGFDYPGTLDNSLLIGTKTSSGSVQLGTYGAVRLTVTPAGNVGIGTTSPTQKLAVNGGIRAKEVIVDSDWSDYVFAPEYQLASLSAVEEHIRTHGHLPGIPSAKEVAENGVSLGEMQALLLAKIEELTLHLIEQEKKIDRLESENLSLRTSK